jgi:hypothetical protein
VGGFATEIFEIRDAARRAGRDHLDVVPSSADDGPGPDDRFDHPGAPGQAPKSS